MMQWFPEYKDANQLNTKLQTMLDIFRGYLGYPTAITAGYSDGTGHTSGSEHYDKDDKGNPCSSAADVHSNAPLWWMLLCAERTGFENIGVYPVDNELHLGIRGSGRRRWVGNGTDNTQSYDEYCIASLKGIMKS